MDSPKSRRDPSRCIKGRGGLLLVMGTQINQHLYVFVPCHNRSELTLKTVGHITTQLNSTAFKYQIHVLDDGSTDGSSSKLNKLNPLIRIHRLSGKHFWGGSLNYIIDYCKNVIYPNDHSAAILIANDDICLKESNAVECGLKLLNAEEQTIIAPVVVDLDPGQRIQDALKQDKAKRNPANVNYGHYFDRRTDSFLPLNSPNASNLGVTVATWFPIQSFKECHSYQKESALWLRLLATLKLSDMGYTIKTDLQYIVCRSKNSTKASKKSRSNVLLIGEVAVTQDLLII